MASSPFSMPSGITFSLLLFMISVPPTHSQNIGNSPRDATIEECGPNFMMLAPCGSFIQGTAPLPTLSCCSDLREFFQVDVGSRCLCLLLTDTSLGSVPVNRTLALQLPTLCNLQPNISACSGLPVPEPHNDHSPNSPASAVTFETRTNSTAATSPVVTVAPKPSVMGLHSQSIGAKLDAQTYIAIAVLTALVLICRENVES